MTILINGAIKESQILEHLEQKQDLQAGGHCVFIGQVRNDHVNSNTVSSIEYSAYTEMVEKEVTTINAEIRKTYPDIRDIVILHSVGMVKAGENSLYVRISAGHRTEAFEAIRDCVNMIKDRVPIWKKENYEDGSHRWIE